MFDNCGKKIQMISGVLLVVGMLATIILAIAFGKNKWGGIDFLRFIAIFAGGGITVYIDALLLNGFGILVESNESQNTVLEQPKKSQADREKEILDEGGWKCVCGRVNNHYISCCACGKSRREGDIKNQ